ncbi:MAG: hypothetical protein ACRD2B_13710 [Terriglobia bacterium]
MKRTILLTACLIASLLPAALWGASSDRAAIFQSNGPSGSTQAAPAGVPGAPQATKAPQWKSRAEYDAFEAIVKAASPQQKLSAANAFVAKYPTSDYKVQADVLKLQSYVQLQQVHQAMAAAKSILKDSFNGPFKITALHYLAYVFPYVYKPTDPDAASQLSTAKTEAQEGLQDLQQIQKPAGLSQEAFESQIKKFRSDFNRALGFAAIQQKDYSGAIPYLKASLEDNPGDGYAASFLGQAYLFMKPPDYNDALWYLARADSLAKKDNTPNLPGLEKLYSQWYEYRHGSNAGENTVVAEAGGSPTPPQGFNVAPPPRHAKTGNPNVDALYSIQDALSVGGNATQAAWSGYKGQPLAIVGFVESVKRGTDPGTYLVKADVLPNQRGQTDVYQLELITDQTGAQYLRVGDPIHFKGTISAYTLTPSFVLTISDAQIDPQSLQMASERAKAAAQQAKEHPTHGRR